MEEPDALKEDYFFRREALRYELENEDDELSLEGTVFNEDWGAFNRYPGKIQTALWQKLFIKDRLLPICLAVHIFIIKIFLYKRIQERFKKFYRYSNCLIVLYGKMDVARIFRFSGQRTFIPVSGSRLCG